MKEAETTGDRNALFVAVFAASLAFWVALGLALVILIDALT